jgi:sulfofructose kinase
MKRVLCVGHAVQDYVFRVTRMPERAEKHRATGFATAGGGPAATAAVAIARLGGAARLAARLGDDTIAAEIETELRGFGVDCSALRRFAGRQSSVSAVFVDDAGERMIVNHTDPRMPTDPTWIDDLALADVDAVLADTRWPEGAARALARARSAGLPAVLDADLPVPADGALLRAATHVAFSEPGLRQYAGDDDLPQALCRVARDTGAWCAVTVGADGVLVADGRRRGAEAAGAVERLPAFRVQAIDTLGAGDAWHGAFALALTEGATEQDAVRAASAAAALKVSRSGGRAALPTRGERDRLLEMQ